MKCSNCVIYRMDLAINRQLVSQYDFAGVSENRSDWCLYLGEEMPYSEIVGGTYYEDDTQTVIDLLGI